MKRRSFSVAGLLVVAAVLGGAIGAVWGSRQQHEVDADAMFDEAEATADRLMPMGAPVAERASSSSITAHPQSLAGIPPYPNATPRRISDATTVMGMPMVVSWFATADSPDQVIEHYEFAYFDAGTPIVSHRFGEAMGYVAWLEEEAVDDGGIAEGIVHMVSALRNTPHSTETLVLLSASRPQRMLDGQRRVPPGVALPARASSPHVMELNLEGRRRVIVTARHEGALTATADEIHKRLEAEGWAIDEVMSGDGLRSFVGRKGGLTQSVSATQAADRRDVSLMYSLEQERAP